MSPQWGPSSQAGWSRRIDGWSMFHVSNVSEGALLYVQRLGLQNIDGFRWRSAKQMRHETPAPRPKRHRNAQSEFTKDEAMTARRRVGDVSSEPCVRATRFERGVPSVQSSGLHASRQAARAVGRRKDRSARRRRSRGDAERRHAPSSRTSASGVRSMSFGTKARQLEAADIELAQRRCQSKFSGCPGCVSVGA